MSIELDLRSPTIVIVGKWNEAILNEQSWVARHILQRSEGELVEVRAVTRLENGIPTANVWSYTDFAISCAAGRLELYQPTKKNYEIYKIINRIITLLPHTPVSGFGVNFKITSDEDVSSFCETIETREKFDLFGVSKVYARNDTIEIAKEMQLNLDEKKLQQCRLRLSRMTDLSLINFDFNFHHDISSIEEISKLISSNPIEHWRIATEKILSDVYEISQYEERSF